MRHDVNWHDLIAQYQFGVDAVKLAATHNVSSSAIYSHLEKACVSRRSSSEVHRKYSIDEGFFDVIDTETKAYWLGFLFADGSVDRNHGKVRVNLAAKDGAHLNALKTHLHSEHPLTTRVINSRGSQYQATSLAIASVALSNRLVELGLVGAKTSRRTPAIPRYLTSHFVRGYFDGDGSISKVALPNNRFRWKASIVTVSDIWVNYLREQVKYGAGFAGSVYNPKNTNLWYLSIGGTKQVANFGRWLYQDSTVYLGRKRERFDELWLVH